MSKIGNKHIQIPSGVTVSMNENTLVVKGSQGEMNIVVPKKLLVEKKEQDLIVTRADDQKKTKSLHGLYRQLIFNAVYGTDKPWEKKLEIVGTGFNVKLQDGDLVMKIGFSHPVVFKKVPQITFRVEGNNKIIVSGIDKQLVGQIAYQIKEVKKPDAYKGKGIRYLGQVIKLKPGKKVKTVGAG